MLAARLQGDPVAWGGRPARLASALRAVAIARDRNRSRWSARMHHAGPTGQKGNYPSYTSLRARLQYGRAAAY